MFSTSICGKKVQTLSAVFFFLKMNLNLDVIVIG